MDFENYKKFCAYFGLSQNRQSSLAKFKKFEKFREFWGLPFDIRSMDFYKRFCSYGAQAI